MNQFSKPETAKADARRERELCRDWTPDDATGEYSGPYLERDRVPLPSCYRRWQHAGHRRCEKQSGAPLWNFARRCR